MSERYLEQWERVKRWYAKIEDFTVRPSSMNQIEAQDLMYAFFINCYHLKDWVRRSRPDLGSEIRDLFDEKKGPTCFGICAGFANGLKHLGPDNKRPLHGNASIVGQSVSVYVPTLTLNKEENAKKCARASYRWTVESNGNQYDAFAIARNCIAEWTNFLSANKLISNLRENQ